MAGLDTSLISKVARQLQTRPAYAEAGTRGSILSVAASSYGFRADMDDLTQPTGFDPQAARLFEALVESAYLVATADGEFDATERTAFEHVVLTACAGLVAERQVRALIADLAAQLADDGLDKRIEIVSRSVGKPEHAREVLRVAALLASVSGGVSDPERDVMRRLAQKFALDDVAIDRALAEASRVLSG
jgi:tellurite resistance protein